MAASGEPQGIFDAVELRSGGLRSADGALVGSTDAGTDVGRAEGNGSSGLTPRTSSINKASSGYVWMKQHTVVVGDCEATNHVMSSNGGRSHVNPEHLGEDFQAILRNAWRCNGALFVDHQKVAAVLTPSSPPRRRTP